MEETYRLEGEVSGHLLVKNSSLNPWHKPLYLCH